MDTPQKIELIQKQLDAVNADHEVSDVNAWKHQNEVAVRLALGVENPTYKKLVDVRFTPAMVSYGPGRDSTPQFDIARRRA